MLQGTLTKSLLGIDIDKSGFSKFQKNINYDNALLMHQPAEKGYVDIYDYLHDVRRHFRNNYASSEGYYLHLFEEGADNVDLSRFSLGNETVKQQYLLLRADGLNQLVRGLNR